MNFVSYETAVRLKEAGFPQPKPMFYQLWYSPNGESEIRLPYYISPLFGGASMIYNSVFAPTADDILHQLPDFALYYGKDDNGNMIFSVFDTLRRIPDQYPTHHGNPAEAAALAWFEFNEK